MKDVTTVSKGNRKTIVIRRRGIGLVFNRRFVEGISANGARIGADIPRPHGHGIPLFYFKARCVGFRRGWERFYFGGLKRERVEDRESR
jgi:hypothetical protein